MAMELETRTMRSHIPNIDLDTPEIQEMRLDLAAALRMCAHLGLHEGIDNHFSALLPGENNLFLVNPYGLSFSEVTASSLLICDFEGNVVRGDGQPEGSAFFIHARLHKLLPRARVAFHTHMPNATALSMLDSEPFDWSIQSSLKFYGRLAFDTNYSGLALDELEGDRIALSVGDADVVFMQNHGVMVVGPTIAQAWDDLYFLERAAEVQIKALSTGRKTKPVRPEIAQKVFEEEHAALPATSRRHLDSVHRILRKREPDYAQ
jgi:ribulose-5-phosphate 4-epimerase/fuculose-1-phosphate aldolase